MIPAIHQSARVHYRVEVLDASGRLIRRMRRRRNLILDGGLDYIGGSSWVAAFTHAAVGTGTTPTKRDSGAVTVSRTGDVLTASAGFFEAADVGRLFKFDTGEEVRISGYTSATEVTTATSGDIAAAEGTVWYVNQTALAAESKRTSTYSTDSGANGSSYALGVWTHKRTFIFAAESGPVTYREIGWSWGGVGTALFGRALLEGAGVSLVTGQQLRVVVELSVAYAPVTSTACGNVGSGGFDSSGQCGIENVGRVGVVGADGTGNGASTLDPGGSGRLVSTATGDGAIVDAVASGNPPVVAGLVGHATSSSPGYVAGTFRRSFGYTYSVSQSNSPALRSIFVQSGGDRPVFRVLLSSAQAKASTQTLRVEYTLSWGRVLSNA